MTTRESILSSLKSSKPELYRLGVMQVGLFGSYARNEQSAVSDIDLLIDFNPSQDSFDNFMAVYDLFEQVFRNHRVEVVTKNGLSKYVGPKILSEVIYA